MVSAELPAAEVASTFFFLAGWFACWGAACSTAPQRAQHATLACLLGLAMAGLWGVTIFDVHWRL